VLKTADVRQSAVPLTRQSAIDWDCFELGSTFTQSQRDKPPAAVTRLDLTETDHIRSQSRQDHLDARSVLLFIYPSLSVFTQVNSAWPSVHG